MLMEISPFWETIGNEVNFFLFNVQILIDETKKEKKQGIHYRS